MEISLLMVMLRLFTKLLVQALEEGYILVLVLLLAQDLLVLWVEMLMPVHLMIVEVDPVDV